MARERFNDQEGEGGDGLPKGGQPAQDQVRAVPVHRHLQFAPQLTQPLHRCHRPRVDQVKDEVRCDHHKVNSRCIRASGCTRISSTSSPYS